MSASSPPRRETAEDDKHTRAHKEDEEDEDDEVEEDDDEDDEDEDEDEDAGAEVQLGFLVDAADAAPPAHLTRRFFPSKLGGRPVWTPSYTNEISEFGNTN
jgi:hypothetical protein